MKLFIRIIIRMIIFYTSKITIDTIINLFLNNIPIHALPCMHIFGHPESKSICIYKIFWEAAKKATFIPHW